MGYLRVLPWRENVEKTKGDERARRAELGHSTAATGSSLGAGGSEYRTSFRGLSRGSRVARVVARSDPEPGTRTWPVATLIVLYLIHCNVM